jgi:hypothetical protein
VEISLRTHPGRSLGVIYQIEGDPDIRTRSGCMCEYGKLLKGGVRPSIRTLKILAAVYDTTCDRLFDINDLEVIPAHNRQAFLDIINLRHSDSLWSVPDFIDTGLGCQVG